MIAVVGGGILVWQAAASGPGVVAVGMALLLFGAARNAWDLFLATSSD